MKSQAHAVPGGHARKGGPQWEDKEEPGLARHGGTCLQSEHSGGGDGQITLGISWKVEVVVVVVVVLVWFRLKEKRWNFQII